MEKINTYTPLSDEKIEELRNEIKIKYQKFLQPFKVKQLMDTSNGMYQLILLYYYQGKAVHKDVISAFVRDHNLSASGDQQVRHLSAQKGYYILGRNGVYNNEKMPLSYYLLVTLEKPDPNWSNNEIKRQTVLSTDDFNILKQTFNYCCATCGAKEGELHPRTLKKVQLQKGHMDPSKPLEKGNIIPQCEYCNQNVYKNDFIFNAFGYPESIYNPKYILKSKDSIQFEMYKILKEKFELEV